MLACVGVDTSLAIARSVDVVMARLWISFPDHVGEEIATVRSLCVEGVWKARVSGGGELVFTQARLGPRRRQESSEAQFARQPGSRKVRVDVVDRPMGFESQIASPRRGQME